MVRIVYKDEEKVIIKLDDKRFLVVTDRGLIMRLKTTQGWQTKNFDYTDMLLVNFIINVITENKSRKILKLKKKLKNLREKLEINEITQPISIKTFRA